MLEVLGRIHTILYYKNVSSICSRHETRDFQTSGRTAFQINKLYHLANSISKFVAPPWGSETLLENRGTNPGHKELPGDMLGPLCGHGYNPAP